MQFELTIAGGYVGMLQGEDVLVISCEVHIAPCGFFNFEIRSSICFNSLINTAGAFI